MLEEAEDGRLGVANVVSRQLVVTLMADEVASVCTVSSATKRGDAQSVKARSLVPLTPSRTGIACSEAKARS